MYKHEHATGCVTEHRLLLRQITDLYCVLNLLNTDCEGWAGSESSAQRKATCYFWIHRQLKLLLWSSSLCFRLMSFVKCNILLWVKLFLHPFHSQFVASRTSSVLTPRVSVSKTGLRHGMTGNACLYTCFHWACLGSSVQLEIAGLNRLLCTKFTFACKKPQSLKRPVCSQA